MGGRRWRRKRRSWRGRWSEDRHAFGNELATRRIESSNLGGREVGFWRSVAEAIAAAGGHITLSRELAHVVDIHRRRMPDACDLLDQWLLDGFRVEARLLRSSALPAPADVDSERAQFDEAPLIEATPASQLARVHPHPTRRRRGDEPDLVALAFEVQVHRQDTWFGKLEIDIRSRSDSHRAVFTRSQQEDLSPAPHPELEQQGNIAGVARVAIVAVVPPRPFVCSGLCHT